MQFKLIIPASGTGSRFHNRISSGSQIPKQFIKINGKEIISLTLEKFHSVKEINEIIISTRKEYISKVKKIIKRDKFSKVKKVVEGGATRQDSVHAAMINLKCDPDDTIIIHDAVRPFISREKIKEMIAASKRNIAVIPGIRISDTIKKTNEKNFVTETVDRRNLWQVQTPQFFRYKILKRSFEKANNVNIKGTDESMIVEKAGYKVKIIEGERGNIKITTREDLK